MSPGRRLLRRPALVSALATLVVALVLVAVLATRNTPSATQVPTTLGGKAAPPIGGTNLLTGKAVHLSSLRGEYVVVNFFASWCGPCQQESAALEAFQFAHAPDHQATVFGVVFADAASNARAFLERTGATWPAVADLSSAIAISYHVIAPPESFVISPAGTVIASFEGAVTTADLDAALPSPGSAGS